MRKRKIISVFLTVILLFFSSGSTSFAAPKPELLSWANEPSCYCAYTITAKSNQKVTYMLPNFTNKLGDADRASFLSNPELLIPNQNMFPDGVAIKKLDDVFRVEAMMMEALRDFPRDKKATFLDRFTVEEYGETKVNDAINMIKKAKGSTTPAGDFKIVAATFSDGAGCMAYDFTITDSKWGTFVVTSGANDDGMLSNLLFYFQ